jgi:hypothetical protein
LHRNCLLLNKSQILDDAQSLKHKRIGLSDRTTASTTPAKYKPPPFTAILTEHVRHILAVLTQFTVERTHENSDGNYNNGGRRE